MKHIGKTNNNEMIVALNMVDINELMEALNAAELFYFEKFKQNHNDRGAELMRQDAGKWWSRLYELRENIK